MNGFSNDLVALSRHPFFFSMNRIFVLKLYASEVVCLTINLKQKINGG